MTKLMTVVASSALLALCSEFAPAQTVVSGAAITDLGGISRSAVGMPRAREARDTAFSLLRQRVEEVNWEETPFEEVIDWLRDLGGDSVNVIPRWNALSVESVDQDSFVTLQLKNTDVADVLEEVFDQLVDDDQIALRAYGNKLKISTKADFGRRMVVRVYDVTDILFRVPNLGEASPEINLEQMAGGGGGGGSGGGRTVFGGGGGGGGGGQEKGGQQAEEDQEERLLELATMIQAVIDPLSWAASTPGAAATGSGRGTIQTHQLLLIVSNTVEVHEQIAGYFSLAE